MRKLVTVFTGLLLMAASVQAQQITGTVKNEKGKELEKATVSLLKAQDSSVVKLVATGDNGVYSFNTIQPGRYLVNTSYVGYVQAYSEVFEFTGSKVTVPVITISKPSGDLAGVVVTSKKPIIEVKADKMILNVEGTINAVGNDALELLRKSPGVMVDKDDNLSLAGKNGVQVYIDGKPSPLAGADLANFLKSTQSSQIEAIEIITNPSAKYEAAGNAGIINIKLKKNKTFGTNGAVNLGYTQGTYPKYTGGINLNHRNKNVNLYGTYNYNDSRSLMTMNSTRDQFDTLFDQNNRIDVLVKSHTYKAGVDYFLGQKSTIGAMVNGTIADIDVNTSGPMYFTFKPTGVLNRILDATNTNDRSMKNFNGNLNYRYAVTGGT